VINVKTSNGTYVVINEARFGASVKPVAAAAWQLTDAVRPHVMAAQLKRATDVFPSSTRGMDPPV
jgi:hypothetical protein